MFVLLFVSYLIYTGKPQLRVLDFELRADNWSDKSNRALACDSRKVTKVLGSPALGQKILATSFNFQENEIRNFVSEIICGDGLSLGRKSNLC